MKLRHAHIQNFKGVEDVEIDFASSAGTELRQLTDLLGDNGSGKTTVLQAIALTLSLATRRTREPADFNWHGFLVERVSSLGRTRVELDVVFDAEEIEATRSLFKEWRDSRSSERRDSRGVVPPGTNPKVTLVYEPGKLSSPQGDEGICQFLGRYYVKVLSKAQPYLRDQFPKLGDIFWFDQHRNLGSVLSGRSEETEDGRGAIETWQAGVEQLREFLVGWWAYHTSPTRGSGRDYIRALEDQFGQLFPHTVFRGVLPRETARDGHVRDFYFLLERDGKVYDLAEMSSGEQAIFPLIYEFVRLSIAKSIVLIDELELHLHPPEQQALLGSLRRIGPDCQFIITTHSRYLEEAIPKEEEVRLGEGRRCL